MQNKSEWKHPCIPQVHATAHLERVKIKMSKAKDRMRLKNKWRTIPFKIINKFERDYEIRKHFMLKGIKGKFKLTYNDNNLVWRERNISEKQLNRTFSNDIHSQK